MDLLNSLEIGVRTLIDAGALGIATFIGQDSHDQVRPSITIYAERGDEIFQGWGNYRATVTVQVRSSASTTTEQAHRERVSSVFNLIHVDDFKDLMSNNSDLTIFAGGDESASTGMSNVSEIHGREENSWLSELRFDCACCLADVA